jgi:hypothetical protein
LVPSGLRAVVVPSGLRVTVQPSRWIMIWWWNVHYADFGIMPTWRRSRWWRS